MKTLAFILILFHVSAFAQNSQRRYPQVPFQFQGEAQSAKPKTITSIINPLNYRNNDDELKKNTLPKAEFSENLAGVGQVQQVDFELQSKMMAAQRENIEGDTGQCSPQMSCFKISNGDNNLENLNRDLEVCDCLESRFNIGPRPLVDRDKLQEQMRIREQKVNEGRLLAALQEFKKNHVSKRDALLLEAHFISDEQTAKLLNIADTKETSTLYKAVLETFKGKVSDQVYKDASLMIDGFNDETDTGNTVLENLNKATKRPESCFPFSEYLRVSMIPKSSAFWKDLLLNRELKNGDDWNYYKILTNYESGINREANKEKLDFLNRNPTLKTLFNSPSEKLTKEVYKNLRAVLKPSASCVRDESCQGAFFRNGGNLQQALKDLYTHPNVQSHHIGTSYVDSTMLVDKIGFSIVEKPSIPSLRFAFSSDNVRYDHCDVNADFKKAPACGEVFEGYCAELKENKSELMAAIGSQRNQNAYTDDWIKDLEAEPSKNQGYLEYQDLMCNRIARTNTFTAEVFNFRNYKEKHCSKNDCTAFDDTQLFKMFIKDTKPTDKFFNKQGQLVKGGQGAQLLAQASAENKTAVREMNAGIISSVKDSNKLSNMGNDTSSRMSISDLLAETSFNTENNKSSDLNNVSDVVNITSEGSFGDSSLFNSDLAVGTGAFNNQFGQGQFSNTSVNDQAIAEARNELNELKIEEAQIQNEIREVKKDIGSSSKDGSSDRALEMRLESLEKLLAEKEKSSQTYQGLISQLIDSNTKLKNQVESHPDDNEEKFVSESNKKTGASKISGVKATVSNEEQNTAQRAPASTESFSTSSAMGGGASVIPSSISSAARGVSRINGALLSKYGIMVQEGQNSNLSVAQEAESSRFAGMSTFKDAASLPLEVSKKAFDQFKVNDLSALQDLYKNSLEQMDDNIIKIMVSLEDSTETLEFYAIKEDGKVVFQPIRKNKLSDLQNALTSY